VDNPTLWFKLLEFVLNNQQVPSAHPFRTMDSLQLREHHRVRGEEEGNRTSDPDGQENGPGRLVIRSEK
jgi:hypothetical protein